ncbi:putative ribonuclease H domain-containing protein [Helianthus annuus]|uniref:Ribonuclease H domain-containing protein n=1 Tax=Helianthus annuus TaxID=4232 RepID=A0A9K3H1M1_HELAN|nr:putative ribonuclease H domain-containing protein [Helianthus annuus]KAJ0455024.1 putative ribonuclease H domain-containing protein [Helianthus annuus]KAJ0830752.1 putative ribonuclease H domain-containing protein [Helianthus annuus]KAJ0844157.1 putative ribonuclease H domain-containing protein [Helianthus annuus]
MGASESTPRSNETKDEEKRKQENNNSLGDAIAAATAVATVAAGAAGVVWGISKMLSNNTETEESSRQVTEPSLLNTSRTPVVYEAARGRRSFWSPPPPGRFKMNTDGACHPMRQDGGVQRGPSGYGGILRDHHGNWVRGFIGFIGDQSDCFTSELYGILKGLELLDKLKLKQAILETDSQAAFQFVTGHDDEYLRQKEIVRASWSIIQKCKQLAEKNGITFKLVPGKDANQCADKLAGMAILRRSAYVEFKDLPQELKYLVEKDGQL